MVERGNLTDDISCTAIVCTGIYTLTGDLCFLFLEFHLVTGKGSAECVTDGSIEGPEAQQLLLLTFLRTGPFLFSLELLALLLQL